MPTSSKNGKRSRGRTGAAWENARRRVLASSNICHICSELIDLSLKYPDPMSATVDHLIPVSSMAWDDPRLTDVEFLAPAHDVCNKRRGVGGYKRPEHKWSRDWFD